MYLTMKRYQVNGGTDVAVVVVDDCVVEETVVVEVVLVSVVVVVVVDVVAVFFEIVDKI